MHECLYCDKATGYSERDCDDYAAFCPPDEDT